MKRARVRGLFVAMLASAMSGCAGEGAGALVREQPVIPESPATPEGARESEVPSARGAPGPASAADEQGSWCTPRDAEGAAASACLRELARVPIGGVLGATEGGARDLTEASVVAQHGAPRDRRVWTQPDPREPLATEHFLELRYPGFTLVLAGPDADVRRVRSLRAADPAVELACGLRIGETVDRFREALGSPAPAAAGAAEQSLEYRLSDYFCTDEGPTYAFHWRIALEPASSGAVESVTWESAAERP